MTFLRINSSTAKDFQIISALYFSSFPENERRDITSTIEKLSFESRFNMLAVYDRTVFNGFINYWQFEDFIFVEHFAIAKELRNKTIGTKCFEEFLLNFEKPVLLEVEAEASEIAAKRIKFYEKMGFEKILQKYQQPPYDGKSAMIPMFLMCNNLEFGEQNFNNIKSILYQDVYKYVAK